MPSPEAGPNSAPGHHHRLGVLRVAATGAAVLGGLYLLCWAAAALVPGLSATHLYLQLFAPAPATSPAALATGFCWSMAFGLVAGALAALVYNALGGLDVTGTAPRAAARSQAPLKPEGRCNARIKRAT